MLLSCLSRYANKTVPQRRRDILFTGISRVPLHLLLLPPFLLVTTYILKHARRYKRAREESAKGTKQKEKNGRKSICSFRSLACFSLRESKTNKRGKRAAASNISLDASSNSPSLPSERYAFFVRFSLALLLSPRLEPRKVFNRVRALKRTRCIRGR